MRVTRWLCETRCFPAQTPDRKGSVCVPLRRPTACRFVLRRDWRPLDTVDTWAAAEHHPGEVQRAQPQSSLKKKENLELVNCVVVSLRLSNICIYSLLFFFFSFCALDSLVSACEWDKVLSGAGEGKKRGEETRSGLGELMFLTCFLSPSCEMQQCAASVEV